MHQEHGLESIYCVYVHVFEPLLKLDGRLEFMHFGNILYILTLNSRS